VELGARPPVPHPSVFLTPSPQFSLYTILSLPILYGIWHTQGESGRDHILGSPKWAGAIQGWLILEHEKTSERISCIGQTPTPPPVSDRLDAVRFRQVWRCAKVDLGARPPPSLSLYTFTYKYINIYVYVYICIYYTCDTCIYMYIYICMCVYILIYMHTYIFIYMYIHIYTCTYLYVRMYQCVYVSMCI